MTETLHELAEKVEGLTCPQCGEDTPTLHEGYCAECCADNQRAIDLHNYSVDRWATLTYRQREDEIRDAILRARSQP